MRFFNTAGPVKPGKHYCIPPLERFDLDEVLALVRGEKYFVLHAPRQTGKTSALLALCDLLDGQGYACVYTTVETARTARDDMVETMRVVLSGMGSDARSELDDDFLARHWSGILTEFGPNMALREALKRWSEASPKPLVLLIDEIDTLQGDPLLSTLQQLRGGYPMRPGAFPQCVVLCGLRDVRDYRIRSTSSPFNIVAESLWPGARPWTPGPRLVNPRACRSQQRIARPLPRIMLVESSGLAYTGRPCNGPRTPGTWGRPSLSG